MFTDRTQHRKSNNIAQQQRQSIGSYGELDSITSLPSKQLLKSISSPQVIRRKNQQGNQNKLNIKLDPLPQYNSQVNSNTNNNELHSSDFNERYDNHFNQKLNNNIKQSQTTPTQEDGQISSRNQLSKDQGEISINEHNQFNNNNSSINSKKNQQNLSSSSKFNLRYSEKYESNRMQQSSVQKNWQNEDSLIENPSYQQLFETNKRITIQNQKREDALNELISQIQIILSMESGQSQKDATIISDALNHLMNTIDNAQKNEMELNKAMREMHKQLKEKLKLQMESEIYKNQKRLGEEELFLYKQKYEGSIADIRNLKKQNMQLTQHNEELRKKNQTYEKRLELLSDYNAPSEKKQHTQESNLNDSLIGQVDNNLSYHIAKRDKTSQEDIKSFSKIQGGSGSQSIQQKDKAAPALYKNGQMQVVLADLVKENENFKKQIKLKEKEIERLKELNYKQQDKMNRLYKKIDMIKMKRTTKDDDNKKNLSSTDEDKFNFEKNELPLAVDFKVQNLPLRSQNFLSDLHDHGKDSFLNQFEDDKKEQIDLIVSQLSSYKEFSEKSNSIIHEILYLINFSSIEEIMIYVSRSFKQNFQAENVHLWIREAETGILRTYNQQGKEVKALTTKGVFHKCIDQHKIINFSSSKEVSLYQDTEGNIVTEDRCVVFPIFLNSVNNQSQQQYLVGLFEVSKLFTERMELDEQYQAILLSKILRFIFKKIHESNVLQSQLRTADMNQEFFQELCVSKSKFQFGQTIKKWASTILQSSTSQFVFVEGDQIILHQTNSSVKSVSSKISLASSIIQDKKSKIFYNSKKQVEYQLDVDISSLLPIYYFPIVIEIDKTNVNPNDKFDETQQKVVVGILQFVIKQKKRISSIPINEIIMLDQGLLSQDIEYRQFCGYVQSAYEILYLKNNS